MTYGNVLVALADPTRRMIFERLRSRPHTVGELADFVDVRQPTVTQHLQVLRDARLVTDQREGTRRFYSASHEGLAELRPSLASLWDDVLAAYAGNDAAHPGPRRTSKRRSR